MTDNFGNCACMNLRRTARLIGQFYDQRLQPGGLRNTQFSLLVMLQWMQPLSVTALANNLGMDRSTLTRNVKVLQKDGLIEERKSKDARVRLLAVTERGSAIIDQNIPYWREAQAAFLQRFGAERWGVLSKELADINAMIAQEAV